MAKTNENYRDRIEGVGKREVNALNKEIREHYKEHGWRKTVSVYKVAPSDLSSIVDPDGKNKAKKKKPKVTKAKAPPKKKAKAKAKKKDKPKKAPKAKKKPGRPKKDASTPAKGKAAANKKKAAATKKKAKKNAKKKDPAATPEDEMVLDYLLRRRKGKDSWRDPETVDQVILDLTSRIRGV